jgi:hypothetical protein
MLLIKVQFFVILFVSVTVGARADTITAQCPGDQMHFAAHNVDAEYFAKWKTLFDESERLERTEAGKKYSPRMLEAHNAFYRKVYKDCEAEARKSGEAMFLAIAIVSKTGIIEQYLSMPPRPEYACFAKKIVGRSYPKPPNDQYPVGFMNIFNDPAGTSSEECIRRIIEKVNEAARRTPNNSFKADGPDGPRP